MEILSILLAILPGLIISFVIYRMDKYEREDRMPLLICFGLGMVATVPGLFFQTWINELGIEESANLFQTFLFSMFIVSLSEELLKFACLMLYPYRQDFFNEPMDGIVYSVMIAMGFATLENVLYATEFGLGTTIVRAFTAIPAHAVFAIFMGYFVGLSRFETNRNKRFKLIGLGLLWAVVIHGVYDFFILQEAYEWLLGFGTLTLYVSIYFAIKLVKQHQINSPFFKAAEEKDIVVNDTTMASTTIEKSVPISLKTNEIDRPTKVNKGDSKYDELFEDGD